MTLWHMLSKTHYDTEFEIYCGNDYDQNILIFKGKCEEAQTDEGVFEHLMDEVDDYYIARHVLVVITKDENYYKHADELYSQEYVSRWDQFEPKSRPWRYSSEIAIGV